MRGATTGAALTETATEAWTTQPNVVSQHGEQRSIRIIDIHRDRAAIHLQRRFNGCVRRPADRAEP